MHNLHVERADDIIRLLNIGYGTLLYCTVTHFSRENSSHSTAGTERRPQQSMAKYNLSKVSSRDDIIWAAARPGHMHPREGLLTTPRGPPIEENAVELWVEHMKSKGIKRVLCLLTRSPTRLNAQRELSVRR